jgi:alpha-beta hydrolase superfamily lysophospholipase
MPWVLRSSFVPRDALVDVELLHRGFHIVTGPVPYNADGPKLVHWDAVYTHLTGHGFSKRPVMEGTGRAAGDVFAWAIANPEKVSCIYAVNAVFRSTMSTGPLLEGLSPLAKAGVPLLLVCGSLDPALNENTRVIEQRYKELGGGLQLMIVEGKGHLIQAPDPAKAADFIARNAASKQ